MSEYTNEEITTLLRLYATYKAEEMRKIVAEAAAMTEEELEAIRNEPWPEDMPPLPPLEEDPVAIRLGFVPPKEPQQ
jgi:hypothetical protein